MRTQQIGLRTMLLEKYNIFRVGNGLASNLVFYGSAYTGGNCGRLWNDVGMLGCIWPPATICMLTHIPQHCLHCVNMACTICSAILIDSQHGLRNTSCIFLPLALNFFATTLAFFCVCLQFFDPRFF